jgi:hypothetical protein
MEPWLPDGSLDIANECGISKVIAGTAGKGVLLVDEGQKQKDFSKVHFSHP